MKPTLPILATVLLFAASESQAAIRAWRCVLPGGTYSVRLAAITSVSRHEYVVDGSMRVYEVTVATTGSTEARFYYIEPIIPSGPAGSINSATQKLQAAAEKAAGMAGVDPVWRQVIKSYPTTTHAHTVEYRLESIKVLDDLFKSAEDAFLEDKDGEFKPGTGT
jgi:hypothetical protein